MAFNVNQRLNGLEPLAYAGVNAVQPPDFVTKPRPPNATDSKNFYLGTIWLDVTGYPTVLPQADNIWMLVALIGNQATWVNFGAGSLTSLTGNTGGPVFPDGADNINVVGDGTTINVAGNPGTHTLTISAINMGTVNTLTGNNALPVSPILGNINIVGDGVTIDINGNPGTHTLTASLINSGSYANSFPTDAGTATPALGVLNIIANRAGLASGSSVFFSAPGAANTVQLNVTDALSNTLIGNLAGNLTLTGNQNTGLGNNVLSALTTGSSNVGVGSSSLRADTTGSFNVAMGVSSLLSNVSGASNVAIGTGALQNNVLFDNNTAVGTTTLQNYVGGVGTSGFNVALGVDALNALQTRNSNTAIGALAGEFLVSGIACTLLGAATGSNLTASESYNVLIGASSSGLSLGVAGVNSLVAISTQNDNWFHNFGTNNIFAGRNAGNGTLTGTTNAAYGHNALNALTTGNGNTAIGDIAGATLLTGINNALIGRSAGSAYVGAESNNIILGGNTGVAAESNVIRIGGTFGSGANQQNALYMAAPHNEPIAVGGTGTPHVMTINETDGRVLITYSSLATWIDVTSPIASSSGVGFFANEVGQTTIALPAISIVGSTISVSDSGGNGWRITQGAGQQIRLGNQATTVGVGGYIESNDIGDTVQLVCSIANLAWQVVSVIGNITVN